MNKQLKNEAYISTNIAFCMVDIMESALMDMNTSVKKAGYIIRHEDKRNFNTAIHALKKLKNNLNYCSDNEQESYGNDADMFYQFIKLLIDRCGTNDQRLYIFYNYIKQFPSVLNLDLTESERIAFYDLNK